MANTNEFEKISVTELDEDKALSKALIEKESHDVSESGENKFTALIESDVTSEDRAEALTRARQKRREIEERESKKNKKKRRKGIMRRTPNYLLEKLPYYVTPSYVEHNGYVMTVVELYNRNGSNRRMSYSDIIELIPIKSYQNVDMHFIVKDAFIKGDEKVRIVQKNAKDGRDVVGDTQRNGTKEDRDSTAAQIMQRADLIDYAHYETFINATSDPIVLFQIQLLIIAHDRETIEEQIEVLNTILDQTHEGAKWDSLGGDQLKRYTGLFKKLPIDRFSNTSTGDNYAGLNFAVNAGLNDARGLPVGRDALALTRTTSYFDMTGSLDRHAFIAIPRSANMSLYTRRESGDSNDEDSDPTTIQPSVASIFGQYVANQAVLDNNRAFHIVMNDWDYMERGIYYRQADTPGMFETFDVSNLTLNPLEGYGDYSEISAAYYRLTEKIVNIFRVINNMELDENQQGIIRETTQRLYTNLGYWNSEAAENPMNTSIINIEAHDSYARMSSILDEMTTLERAAAQNNRERRADSVKALESLLRSSLSAFTSILNRPTNITPSDARQVYYNFNNISSANLKMVQLLNLFDYIVFNASPGDVIILHGIDEAWHDVMLMLRDSVKAAEKKGIRFVFTSDAVMTESEERLRPADIFSLRHYYYKDLDTDVDWSIIGRCLEPEVDAYEEALAQPLSDTIRMSMMQKSRCQVMIHRKVGSINTFVNASVII